MSGKPKPKFQVGNWVMLYAKVTVITTSKRFAICTEGGNHIIESGKDLYSPARPLTKRERGD